MKSIVEYFTPTNEIEVPDQYLEIPITSWEVVIQPLLEEVANRYGESSVTDEMVAELGIGDVSTVEGFRQFAKEYYQDEYISYAFYHKLLPFLLAYHGETAEVVINAEERDSYVEEYLEQIEAFADEAELPVNDYAQLKLGLRGDIPKILNERAVEDYTFKLIAHHIFKAKGHELDEMTYERFIQQNVLRSGADEIEMRERYPYPVFKKIMPEMSFNSELFDYYKPKFTFKVTGETV